MTNKSTFIQKISLCLIVLPFLFLSCKNTNTGANIVIDNKLSLAATVKHYWNASFDGDVNVVQQLITSEPKSFYYKCEPENKTGEALTGGNVSDDSSNVKVESQDEEITRTGQAKIRGPFGKYYDKNSEFFSIYGTSHLINISRFPVRNLVIENEFTFEDEARVDLFHQSPTSEKHLDSSVFLKKEESGWKIFLIRFKSELQSSDNEYYGKPKPKCPK